MQVRRNFILVDKSLKSAVIIASLIPPLCIEVSVPSQETERSSIYVLWVSILPISNDFFVGFCNCLE